MELTQKNLQLIREQYDARVTRRLEYLSAMTETVFFSEDKAYMQDRELDAFVAISALSIITTELENIIQEASFMSNVLKELQQQTKAISGQEEMA